MKKLWLIILTVLMSMSFVLAFAACGNPPAPAHEHTLSEAYSSDDEYHWKTCSGCNELIGKTEHTFSNVKVETLKEGTTCVYELKQVKECTVCHKQVVVSSEEVEKHEYELTGLQEATCRTNGVKTYTCKHCNAFYEEEFENPLAHCYEGVTENGVTTYTCKYCGDWYYVIDAKDQTSVEVSGEQFTDVGAVELKNAIIYLDSDLRINLAANENITVAAEEKTTADIQVSDEIKGKIGDKPVYDFSMEADGEKLSDLGGYVIITVPYVLSEGEDPDNIVVWYLNGDRAESIRATYVNGFVRFETNHFSLYTVVRLSREETCDFYGHNYLISSQKPATCVKEGSITYLCRRCGETEIEVTEKADHEYEIVENVPSTTTVEGHMKEVCKHCGDEKITVYPLEKEARDNLIELLLRDIMSNSLSLTFTENDAINNMYLVMDEFGNLYPVTISDERISVTGIDGTQYEICFEGDKEDYYYLRRPDGERPSMSTAVIFGMAKSIISAIPTPILDMVWKVGLNFVDMVEDGEELTMSLNLDKVAAVYRDVMNNPISESIDMLLGEDTYASIRAFIEFALTEDIPTIITAIENFGFDLNSIIGLVGGMAGMPEGMDILAMLKAMEDAKILDMAPMIIALMQAQGMAIPEGIEQMLNAEIILAMVDNYAAKSVCELTEMPAVPENFSGKDLLDMINMLSAMANYDEDAPAESQHVTIVNDLGLILKITKDGKFISLNITAEATYDEKDENIEINLVKGIEEEIDYAGIIEKVTTNYGLFPEEVTEENYQLFVQDLTDKFGLNFTYTLDNDEVILVSDVVSETYDDETYNCKYEAIIGIREWYTVKVVKDYPEYLSRSYERTVYCYVEDGDSDVFYFEWSSDLDITLLYNDAHGYFVVPYGVNTEHFYVAPQQIDKAEYVANNPDYKEPKLDKYYENYDVELVVEYYKAECLCCGKIIYFTKEVLYHDGIRLVTGSISSNAITFPMTTSIGTHSVLDFNYGKNAIGSYLEIWQSHSASQETTVRNYLDGNYKNITLEAFNRYSNGEGNTYNFDDVTITVLSCDDGKGLLVGTYNLKVGNVDYGVWDYNYCYGHYYIKDTVEKGCTKYTIEYCVNCGGYRYFNTTEHTFDRTDYTEVTPFTQTTYGLVKAEMTCSVCGEKLVYYAHTSCPNNNWETVGDTHTCTDCGFSYQGDIMPKIILDTIKNEGDELVIGFKCNDKEYLRYEGYETWCVQEINEGKDTFYRYVDMPTALNIFNGYQYNAYLFYTGEYTDINYINKHYAASACIGFYNENNELTLVEGVSEQASVTRNYEGAYEIAVVYNTLEFNTANLNAVIAEEEAETENDYFIVVCLVDLRNAEVLQYIVD